MSGPTLGVTKLRTVRKVCCDILAIAGKWVRQRERLSDALKIERGDNDKDTAATEEFAALDFESAQSSLLVKAFQCFTQVRSRCLDVGLEGFHAHQQKKSSEIGKDDPAPVNADQISGAEYVVGLLAFLFAPTLVCDLLHFPHSSHLWCHRISSATAAAQDSSRVTRSVFERNQSSAQDSACFTGATTGKLKSPPFHPPRSQRVAEPGCTHLPTCTRFSLWIGCLHIAKRKLHASPSC